MLFASGDESDQVYFVAQGHLRCLHHSPTGRLVTLADVGPGEMVGEFAAINGLPRMTDVVSLTETVLVVMPAVTFRALIGRELIARNILQDMSRRMSVMTDRIVELSTLEVDARVRIDLFRVATQHPVRGKTVTFPAPRHIDIASRVCANREAVTRAMARMTRAGLVEKQHRNLVIPDFSDFCRSLSGMVAGLPRLQIEQTL
jgi:CRP-like cAMP-binding protein